MSKHPRNPKFRDIAAIHDPDGVVAVISVRIDTGRCSASIFREFEKDGTTRRSTFFARRHIPAVRRLCDELEETLDRYEDRCRAELRAERELMEIDFDAV
jgi:hypothetical protein